VSTETRRRAGIVALLALLAGGLLLAVAPLHIAAIRLRGVALLWWYAALLAPVTAAAVAAVTLVRRRR
jgi:hypothetical protein